MKKQNRLQKLTLHRETLNILHLVAAQGDPIVDGPVSRAFSNCNYCNGTTKWAGDCTQV